MVIVHGVCLLGWGFRIGGEDIWAFLEFDRQGRITAFDPRPALVPSDLPARKAAAEVAERVAKRVNATVGVHCALAELGEQECDLVGDLVAMEDLFGAQARQIQGWRA